jgi:hypothetical protein
MTADITPMRQVHACRMMPHLYSPSIAITLAVKHIDAVLDSD